MNLPVFKCFNEQDKCFARKIELEAIFYGQTLENLAAVIKEYFVINFGWDELFCFFNEITFFL